MMSGASAACAPVAGVIVLLKGVHPNWIPAAIRSPIMTTSDVLDNTFEPIQDLGNDHHP